MYARLISRKEVHMALGVPGTGPYSSIKSLQQEINNCKYELKLIAQGIRRKFGPKRLNQIITTNRTKIKQIKDYEKAKK